MLGAPRTSKGRWTWMSQSLKDDDIRLDFKSLSDKIEERGAVAELADAEDLKYLPL
jgi:hypothetical protein